MGIEKVRQEMSKLVEKYNNIATEKGISKYNEEMTKKDFILPLFRALGWDVENSDEVLAEEKISKGRVDYSFRINGIPKFFLEAKALKVDLDNPKFVEQAINYAWHKGCAWAVLTDFEGVKIFNAEWKTSNPFQSHFKTILSHEFLDRFSELQLLSKESFEQGLIDKEAEKWGKKTKKISVDKQLLADFTRFRELLSKNITKLNQSKNLTEEDLDESVQRILSRLIFIRNCEDRGLEEKTLISNLRDWEIKGRRQLIKGLREVFAYFNKQYNSKIFITHLCDDLDIDSEVLSEIIEGLYYTKDKSVSYDFSAIEADVLGNIYEQYLGHVLKKTEKRAKLTANQAHRKEQGIYYTPTYIVDYVVRNTLGELLKNQKVNIEKIRILDPACGSGSFLIKAFDVLNEYYSKHYKNYDQLEFDFKTEIPFTTKAKILQNNIFGVDLDKQAVEIARLNLLLKITERGHRLPLLQENIKCGNSLIDDTEIAGDKAFKWEEEFREIMDEGGFDVVIGNPPYVRVDSLSEKDKEYWKKIFESSQGKYDIYYLFIENVFRWLKNNGMCGFIVPNKFCAASFAKKLREIILDNSSYCMIISVSHLDVFKDASNYPVILILRKGKGVQKINITSAKRLTDFLKENFVEYSLKREELEILPSKIFPVNINQKQFNLVIKLLKKNERLFQYLKISEALRIPQTLEEENFNDFEILKQFQFNEYSPIKKGNYISEINLKKVISSTSGRYINIFKEKIVIAEDALDITATIDDKNRVPQGGVYFGVILKENICLKYILGLLNSKLLSFVYKILFGGMHMGGGYLRYRTEFLEQLPIKIVQKSKQQTIIETVDKMLALNKHLVEISDKKTDERARIEEEIKKIDNEIDELVYKIYNITAEEKKIIEDSLNEKME